MISDSIPQDILKIVMSIVLGGIIGTEREYHTKSAGFRTLMLVTLGSTLFTIVSTRLGVSNPDRIAANIITGIGFLGAGVIYRSEKRVNGITTAAIIWAAAAVGMGVGSDEYFLSVLGTVVIVLVLIGLNGLEEFIDESNQNRTYRIVCEFKDKPLFHYEEVFRSCNLKIHRGVQSKDGSNIIGTWELRGALDNHEKLTTLLLQDKDIRSFDF